MANVDRGFFRLISMKRIGTGSFSIACGVGLIVALFVHGTTPPPIAGLGLLIFFGGGAWTLRDGLRMRRELVISSDAPPLVRQQPDRDSRRNDALPGVQQ